MFVDGFINSGVKTTRENTWDLTLGNADQPIEARVMTESEREIHGFIHVYGSNDNGTDILLRYPQYVVRQKGEIVHEIPIGEYVFVSQDDVGHIFFESDVNCD